MLRVDSVAVLATHRVDSSLQDFARDPTVVITFSLDPRDADHARTDTSYAFQSKGFYRHYHILVVFPNGSGIYAFESFSSGASAWTMGSDVADVKTVVPSSQLGALGLAFWCPPWGVLALCRPPWDVLVFWCTTVGTFPCYEPVSRCADLVSAPAEKMMWPCWSSARWRACSVSCAWMPASMPSSSSDSISRAAQPTTPSHGLWPGTSRSLSCFIRREKLESSYGITAPRWWRRTSHERTSAPFGGFALDVLVSVITERCDRTIVSMVQHATFALACILPSDARSPSQWRRNEKN